MRLRPLSLIFPDTSRATLWRWRKQGLLGEPDFVAHGREYYNEARFVKPLAPPPDDAGEQGQSETHTAA